jgi:hypothetical protein
MAYEMKELTGTLFDNNRKEKDTHPNKTGSCKIDGKEYWISAWIKYDDAGRERFSLAFKLKEEKADKPRSEQSKSSASSSVNLDLDDSIPF